MRFSPDGLTLASAGDDGAVVLWKDQGDRASSAFGEAPRPAGSVNWRPLMLGGHGCDVYDLCWAPSGERLFSGCVDQTFPTTRVSRVQLGKIFLHEIYIYGSLASKKEPYGAFQ